MGIDWLSVLYAVGNVSTSVTLVLLNKSVFSGGFHFPMSLTTFHFAFTIAFYKLLGMLGYYEPPQTEMPQYEKFKVGAAGFCSIGFMNLSLNFNSVGFYQITKLMLVPTVLVINMVLFAKYETKKILLALSILLLGVGIATVSDVQLRLLGFIFGLLAVMTTAIFQIWQGTKQKEFGITATQLQASIAVWQTLQGTVVSMLLEGTCWNPPLQGHCDTATQYFTDAFTMPEGSHRRARHQYTLMLVLLSCFLALAVNLCSFGLIGRTGPITFQVVGHAKTCLVLAGGYVFFPVTDTAQLYNNVAGVGVAMLGVFLYSHLKYMASQERRDCLDYTCPECCLRVIEPESYSAIELQASDEGSPLTPPESDK